MISHRRVVSCRELRRVFGGGECTHVGKAGQLDHAQSRQLGQIIVHGRRAHILTIAETVTPDERKMSESGCACVRACACVCVRVRVYGESVLERGEVGTMLSNQGETGSGDAPHVGRAQVLQVGQPLDHLTQAVILRMS